jgi:NADH:ubiquinone oxidoreductase subunit
MRISESIVSLEDRLNARWVEYADHHRFWKTGDTIPPEWDGWLKYLYSDIPSKHQNFVSPFYQKPRNPVMY